MMKTVTHEGNVYEIGKLYLFSDESSFWHSDELKYVDNNDSYKFKGIACAWRYCKPFAEGEIGTITPAPIELIDGDAYMFDYKQTSRAGVYSLDSQRFYFVRGHILASYCTNIRPMAIVEK